MKIKQINNSRKYLVISIFVLIVIDAIGTGMVAPILAPLVKSASGGIFGNNSSLELKHLLYGIAMGFAPLFYMLGAPIIGYVSDKIGRKKMLLFCLSGTLFAFISYSLAFVWSSIVILLLAKIIDGFTTGSQSIGQAVMADISSRNSTKIVNISTVALAMTVGLITGPLIGGILSDPSYVSWFNKETPFYAAIFLSFVNLVMLICFFRETHYSVEKNKPSSRECFKKLSNLLKNKNILVALTTFFLFELGWSLYFQSMPLYLSEKFNYKSNMIGIFVGYVGFALSFGLIVIVRILARFKINKIVKYGLIFSSFSFLFCFIAGNKIFYWISVVPIAFSVAICYSALVTTISGMVESEAQGLIMGTTDSMLALAFTITGFLSGILSYLSLKLPLLLALIFMIGGTIMFFKIKKVFIASSHFNENDVAVGSKSG